MMMVRRGGGDTIVGELYWIERGKPMGGSHRTDSETRRTRRACVESEGLFGRMSSRWEAKLVQAGRGARKAESVGLDSADAFSETKGKQ